MEIDKKKLALRLGQCESVLAQERVEHEIERREAKEKNEQQVQLIKQLKVQFRCVRTIVRQSIAKIRGDPPSMALEHHTAKKRMRVEAEPPAEDELEPIDLEELIDSFLTPADQGSSSASV